MTVYDFVGVPFPRNNALFSDPALQHKIKQIEDYVEIESDLHQVHRTLKIVEHFHHIDHKDWFYSSEFQPIDVSEGLISAAVMQYAKAFVQSEGRTSLGKNIFNNEGDNTLEVHEQIMNLRHKLFAHHQFEANHHQLFVIPLAEKNRVFLNPYAQNMRLTVSKSLSLPAIYLCVNEAINIVQNKIETLSKNIESTLSQEQIDYLNNTPKAELLKEWRLNQTSRPEMFQHRIKH